MMKERNYSIDLVKVIAMLGVIGLHSFGHYMDNSQIADVLYRTSGVSIPLFFVVSGYLMASKENVNWNYTLKKIVGILRYVAVMCVAYFICATLLTRQFNPLLLLNTYWQSFFQEGFWWQFWYLGAMIIIYALLPIIFKIINKSNWNIVLIGLFLLLCCNIVFISNLKCQTEPQICQTLRLWNWLFYFMMGVFFMRYKIRLSINTFFVLVLSGGGILNVLFQRWLINDIDNAACEFFYSSMPLMVLVGLLFAVIVSLKLSDAVKKCIGVISPLFLPVYTFHIFFTARIFRSALSVGIYWLDSILLFFFVSILSILFSYILMRIKYVDKFIHI